MEPLKKEWKDARVLSIYFATITLKRTVVAVFANINHECWVLYKARRPIDHIQPYLITNMSLSLSPNTLLHLITQPTY